MVQEEELGVQEDAAQETAVTAQEKKLQRRRPSRAASHDGERIEWPQWNTLRRRTRFCIVGSRRVPPEPLHFTLRIEPNVAAYTQPVLQRVEHLHNDTVQTMLRIRSRLYDSASSEVGTTLQRLVGEGIMTAVYGSNLIDKAGCNMPETMSLCRAVLEDERLMYSGISPRSAEYRERLEYVIRSNVEETSYRKRREVVNHMAAFCYMANKFVGEGNEFSEALVKETHRILCRNLGKMYADDEDKKSRKLAGRYRNEDVWANTFKFPPHRKVQSMMKKFIKMLNGTIRQVEKMQALDPFYVAASVSAHFVNIHPFLNGNGRMCRIILNTILLKYAGIAVPLGVDEKERKTYLGFSARRSHAGKGDGEMARYVLLRANKAMKGVERSLLPTS